MTAFGFREKGPVGEQGLCQMCGKRPADYLELICLTCQEAVEAGEPWTLKHKDLLDQLREAEAEEAEQRAA
jgi:hypothetical protein